MDHTTTSSDLYIDKQFRPSVCVRACGLVRSSVDYIHGCLFHMVHHNLTLHLFSALRNLTMHVLSGKKKHSHLYALPDMQM